MSEAATSAWPLITRDPDVRGGRACLAGTGVTVLALVLYCRRGWNAAQIQRDVYPELPLSAIDGALAWADAHPDEVLRDYAPPLVSVAGPEVDVGAEVAPGVAAYQCELCACGHPRFMHCAVAGCCAQNLDESECECAAFVPQPTRAERIEAAARVLVAPDVMLRAALDLWNNEADPVRARALRALHALRAALCTCTAHGPDLACPEHGEALRKWQKENGT